ncbi:Hypothetical predicted protein [Mytilus galloprovincialis]|uniref:Uncharacterized protein n=1 Tax=Mytilus galloprovincialis TaxID=29158 RepID=A0A8B6BGS9_MYTGA|nr:Hypothetical predicted protein [Mytilus galloprovincialis]
MTEEAKTEEKTVVIAMDGSEYSKFAFKSPYSYDPEVLEIIFKKEKDRVTQKLQQFSQLLTEYGVPGTVKSAHTSNPGEGIVK